MTQNGDLPNDKVCKNAINEDRLLNQTHDEDSSRVDNGVEIGEILIQIFSSAAILNEIG